MQVMKSVKDFFTSQEKESSDLVAALAVHMETWPTVKREYDRIDAECIAAARDLAAEQLAGSPRALETSVNLRKLRWQRDSIKAGFQRKKDELQRRISAINRQDIVEFHLASLDKARDISRFYRFSRQETTKDVWSGKKTVTISHNSDALETARARVLAGITEVCSMEYEPLGDVRNKITDLENEFNGFRFATMQIEEVSESAAAEMKPRSASISVGYEKLNDLNSRVNALERI